LFDIAFLRAWMSMAGASLSASFLNFLLMKILTAMIASSG
jgi:hypothetical protein